MLLSKKVGFPEVYVGPGGFKKVREACRNNFHQFSWKLVLGAPSYDQKTANKSRLLTSRLLKFERIRFFYFFPDRFPVGFLL